MKPSRIIMGIIAWLGLTITLLITALTLFYETLPMWRVQNSGISFESGAGEFYVTILIYFGIVLTLIFGFIAKPRYLWLGLILVGLIHIIGFSGYYNLMYYQGINTWGIVAILPGFLLIGSGFILRKIAKKHV